MTIAILASEGTQTQGFPNPYGSGYYKANFALELWDSDNSEELKVCLDVPTWILAASGDEHIAALDTEALLCPLRALFEDYFANGFGQAHFGGLEQLETLLRWMLDEQIPAAKAFRAEFHREHPSCCVAERVSQETALPPE